MDVDLYWVILFFFFVVLPLIQRVLGVGKHGQPPQRRPPPRRTPGARRLPETPRRQVPPPAAEPARRTDAEADRAAEMIPAELWEILTGQRRPPVVARPPSQEPDVDEELAEDEEDVFAPVTTSEDRAADELMRRREAELVRDRAVDRTPPTIVTLETEPLAEPARHAAFHAQLESRLPTRPAPATVNRPPRHALADALSTRSDLRRSIILQEILGRPKGLQDI